MIFFKNLVAGTCLQRPVLLSALGFLILVPCARAVQPPPDGGYDNFNTAEGTDALLDLQVFVGAGNTALGNGAMRSTTTGLVNTATGSSALFENETGGENTATGAFALDANTTGSDNTAIGQAALVYSSTGNGNTAVGRWALNDNSLGSNNTATGYNTLGTITGTDNTADGANALYEDSVFNDHIGSRNVAIGSAALYSNSTGGDNTAIGVNALYFNKADYNTATGYQALENNTTGTNNTAHGLDSLNANTIGNSNTTNGAYALFHNLDGNSNTAAGDLALDSNTSGSNNTAFGIYSLYGNSTGASNIAVGFSAGFGSTTGSNNIDIGNLGVAGESGIIRVGKTGTQTATYIAGITGVSIVGAPVTVSSTGQLGIRPSSARFKEQINAMEKASEVLYALKPVTFHYKKELDPESAPQFGLVAEEVAEVNPDLVTCDEKGKPYTVRYEAVNTMLLNEFLKKHRQGQEQERKLEKLESRIADLQSALSQRDAEIQAITDNQ